MAKKSRSGYVVFECREGCAEEYVGFARTLKLARRMARQSERGEVSSTPASMWATAEAAGGAGVPGCSAPAYHPDSEEEPIEWAGRDGFHAIFAVPE